MAEGKPDLKAAYALKTPQDSRNLYRGWAKTYDVDFAEANDYRYPGLIADMFAERAKDNAPVLDVGAGTGLVGEALARNGLADVDALDISPEMLAVAMGKGCYRAAITADLTQSLDIADGVYGGVACAGTFTFGHVGAEAIDELLRVARPGALFVLGINAAVYESAGFGAKFSELSGAIRGFEIVKKRIHGARADKEMRAARSSVAVFWKG